MAALFSDRNTRRPSPSLTEMTAPRPASTYFDPEPEPEPSRLRNQTRAGYEFNAELDLCELDDRERPGLTWGAQAQELSRSHLVFRSRRMCYTGRKLLVAVHLIDDRPVALAGTVTSCSYDSEGMYLVEIEFMRLPAWPDVAAWVNQRRPRY